MCKERVNKFARIQTNQSIRLGYWIDLDVTDEEWAKSPDERKSYFTMSEENNYTIWSFLKKCHDRQLIYRGYEATAEVKYFLSNAIRTPLARLLRVAFRRATVEHTFQLGKQEAGLLQYEGRKYVGLVRHLLVVLFVMGFVSLHTERLRKKIRR